MTNLMAVMMPLYSGTISGHGVGTPPAPSGTASLDGRVVFVPCNADTVDLFDPRTSTTHLIWVSWRIYYIMYATHSFLALAAKVVPSFFVQYS